MRTKEHQNLFQTERPHVLRVFVFGAGTFNLCSLPRLRYNYTCYSVRNGSRKDRRKKNNNARLVVDWLTSDISHFNKKKKVEKNQHIKESKLWIVEWRRNIRNRRFWLGTYNSFLLSLIRVSRGVTKMCWAQDGNRVASQAKIVNITSHVHADMHIASLRNIKR